MDIKDLNILDEHHQDASFHQRFQDADSLELYPEMVHDIEGLKDIQQQHSISLYLEQGKLLCISCIESAIMQTFSNLLLSLIIANFSLIIVNYIFSGYRNIRHISTVLIGQATLYNYLTNNNTNEYSEFKLYTQISVPILIFVITIVSNTLVYHTRTTSIVVYWTSWIIGILVILVNELFIALNLNEFIILRPILMVISMKYISLNVDKSKELEVFAKKKNLSLRYYSLMTAILSDSAYLSHPASSILGAWHPQLEHHCSYPVSFRKLYRCSKTIAKSLAYLVISTCLSAYLLDIIRLLLFYYMPSSQLSDYIIRFLEI